MKTAKETIIEKILTDLPIASCRGEMTKEEWRGWFEEAFEKGEKYASQSKWVSCAERLPEIEDEYIVAGQGLPNVIVSTLCFVNGKWWSDVFKMNVDQKKITHWQPLPDKPVE